ncbi:MAG TPA: class I tRNA ligase family protein, partial [Candidatus Paceibacterota bacterium]|nr:class I tRNA ligase family protein [Candidatus Paceibacterota bacterium]
QFREVRPPKIEGNVRRSNLQNIEFYILAKERLSVIQEPLEIVQEVKGKDLVGLNYEPLFDVPAVKSKNSYKVYPADFVTTDEGTGVVHTAVVYGEEDYELGVKVGLPVVPLLDEKGIFNDKAPTFLRGKYFKKADQMIIENLEKRKLLFKKEKHTHSYPHCWRCETPLFYNAIPAWFINIQKIKKKIIESNKKEINWFPEHLKRGRYENSVKDAPDWNISRNRYWGNPIPIWRCEKCSNLQCIGSLNELDRFAHHKSGNAYFLLRHGEADSNVTGTISMDVKDSVHLTDYGRKQVVKASKKLVSFGIDHIFSSDLTRTKETAEIVAEKLGIKPKYDARLRELNHGEFNGRKIDEYLSYYRERGWNRVDYAVPGGETLPQVRARLMSFFKELEEKYRGKRILIIGHGDPLWVLERTLFGWNDEDFRRVDKVSQPYPEYPEKGEIRKVLRWNLPRDEQGMANLHRPYIDEIVLSCSKCGGKAVRIKEIFDSWFEAGSMPFAEYHYPFENKKTFKNRFPAQFVAEYIAQTRAWFYVMHVVSLVLFGKAPFENVVTTGTILAEDGSKMSKSKGNFPDPWKVIERYGVDALRFYLMNSSVMRADDLNFSEKEVEKIYRKNILILWNVYRYFETYSHVVKNSKFEIRNSKLTNVLDVWIEARTKELINLVTGYLDIYDTVRATRAIEEYINDLSTWYVRRSRGRQDASFFATLHDSLIKTSQVIAPFMPYLAEVLYLNLTNGNESVHLTDWPKTEKLTESEKTFLHEMSEARRLASLALAKRAEAGIKVRQPLASLKINPRRFDFPKIGGNVKRSNLLELLKDEINIKEIIFDPKIIEEIELETEITHELKEEGWLREFKRLVQGLRKDAGLYPKDEIVLVVELPEELNHVVQKNENLIKKEVNAKSVEYGRSHKFESELETKIDDYPVWVGLRKPL